MTGLINVCLYFAVSAVIIIIATFIFTKLVRYNVWDQIHKGNIAVAMSTGGLILGLANIIQFAIRTSETIYETTIWGMVGVVALFIVYFGFELLTSKLDVMREIEKDNRAVGFITMMYIVAFSFVIAACIS
jgi:putative membrane protein